MEKKNIKKYLIILLSLIIVIWGIKIGYSCSYVGDIVATYPWDEYTLSEKSASILMGYGKSDTKQQLYDKGLINSDKVMYQKFNNNYYENNSNKDSNSNFNKSELENMYLNPDKYIDQEINFKGKIMTEFDSNEKEENSTINIDFIVVKIDNTNVLTVIPYDKNKIDYENWKKGTIVNVSGKIKSLTEEDNSETITLYDNPTIKI